MCCSLLTHGSGMGMDTANIRIQGSPAEFLSMRSINSPHSQMGSVIALGGWQPAFAKQKELLCWLSRQEYLSSTKILNITEIRQLYISQRKKILCVFRKLNCGVRNNLKKDRIFSWAQLKIVINHKSVVHLYILPGFTRSIYLSSALTLKIIIIQFKWPNKGTTA